MQVDRGEGVSYVAFRIPGTGLELFVSSLAPRSEFREQLTHAGFDVCYVVAGEVVLEFNGADYTMRQGECFTWPGSYPHRVRNDGSEPAVIVAISTETVY